MASMLLTPFAVNGGCIITLHSVFAQGIQALDTLLLYIYYKLLVKVMYYLLNTLISCYSSKNQASKGFNYMP